MGIRRKNTDITRITTKPLTLLVFYKNPFVSMRGKGRNEHSVQKTIGKFKTKNVASASKICNKRINCIERAIFVDKDRKRHYIV